MNNALKFLNILEKKVEEGVEALESTSITTKEYGTLLQNIIHASNVAASLRQELSEVSEDKDTEEAK